MGATKENFIKQQEEIVETGLTFELNSLIHADKARLKSISKHIVQQVQDGEVDAFKAFIANKKLLDIATDTDTNLREIIKSKGIPKAGLNMFNVEFTAKSDPSKYDYSACEDFEWNELQSKLKNIQKEIKEREAFLKVLKKDLTEIDDETGEVKSTIHPPKVITGAENFTSTIK